MAPQPLVYVASSVAAPTLPDAFPVSGNVFQLAFTPNCGADLLLPSGPGEVLWGIH